MRLFITQTIKILAMRRVKLVFLISLLFLFYGCSTSPPSNLPQPLNPATPTIQPEHTVDLPPTATPDLPSTIWIDPLFPDAVHELFSVSPEFAVLHNQQDASLTLSLKSGFPFGTWTYLLVSPFPSLVEGLNSSDLLSFWQTGSSSSSFPFYELALSEETRDALTLLWGEPDPGVLLILEPDLILPALWSEPESIGVIPFEQLNPYWKVLSLDDQNPLHHDFIPDLYDLTLPFFISSLSPPLESLLPDDLLVNFDSSKLTTIALTGVTALVRDTAFIMEEKGLLYPAEEIRSLLENADITHISNEVPFAEDCPTPDSNQSSLYFCSKDEYLQLLEILGTDIVELSGDHFGDWGPEAMLHSLDLYHKLNWLTYGGGETLEKGLKPVFIEHNGNQFAFIGCNGKVHDRYATASATNPGASRCDFEWMQAEITRLNDQGYLVIATMQHEEIDSFYPVAIQQWDFRRLADAGAVIVSGSQAHHPQAFELNGTSLIHYGLGNLFFDQWYLAQYNPDDHINKDKSFIDLHHFYNGSYINTQLITLQFVDNARPRLMTPSERNIFLSEVFQASTWGNQ
ncbi:MAG: CapA family protein [Anaerolineales bacterium]|nr:CapA family protein [Anaerolineales bacterium]